MMLHAALITFDSADFFTRCSLRFLERCGPLVEIVTVNWAWAISTESMYVFLLFAS